MGKYLEKKLSLIKEIPAGYKQTEIGVIPEDWDVKKLGDVADITKLAGFEYTNYFNSYKDGGEIIVIRGTNITHNKLDLTDIRTIPRSTSNKLPRSKLSKYDLVFAYVGTIGPVFLVDKDDAYHLGPNTSKITVQECMSPKFLFTYFTSWLVQNEIVEHTSIGAQPSLSMTKIRRFRIILPPTKTEQTAIATVLSDTDTLIEKLEKLIAKKKAIKQGSMQQLLTGKKRLPGFSGEWEVRSFGEVLSRINGKKYQVQTSDYQETGKYPVVDQGKDLVVGYSDRDEKGFQCPKGGVVVFGDHTCIVKFVDFDFVVGADGTQILVAKSGHCTRFYAFQLMYRGIATTGYNRHFKFLKERTFFSPDSKEQIAIAAVLSDMDAELESLKKKRDKYAMLKQGMMQQLLTGRIRINADN